MNVHIVDLIGPPIRYHQADVVILACQVVENLARTGTYRQQLIEGGIRRPLEKVVRYAKACLPKFQRDQSLFHSTFIKSKLGDGQDKKGAQKAAQAALDAIGKKFSERLTLSSSKYVKSQCFSLHPLNTNTFFRKPSKDGRPVSPLSPSLVPLPAERTFTADDITPRHPLKPRNSMPARRPNSVHVRSRTTGAISNSVLDPMPPAYVG